MANTQEILFGTGELYIIPDGVDVKTSTEEEWIKVGESNGEATLKIEYDFTDVRGGVNNQILGSFLTSETVTFNAGIVTYDLSVLQELLAGYYNEDTTNGKRTLGIGGKKTVPVKRLRFVHFKEDGYKLTMDMFRAQNRSGLEWTFKSDENTAFEFEFTLLADPTKQNGNIVLITEEMPPEGV
ncbi:hypothetical protein [Tuberibacillus calidus]|uniref:hypothetical protein n=1 Tax=Tuberibacillus calidus TaxID=340097 RepID=UPI000426DFA8|nr:hypothetical protein [Tuberibacillus calidus]